MSHQPSWIAHVDLTSLDRTKESTASITTLAHTASRLNTACVCVYSERIVEAKSAGPSIAVATVVNFPDGSDSQSAVVAETVKAVESGATEIDVVWNYKAYKDGDVDAAVAPVEWVAQAVKDKSNVQIKVILESGAIEPSTLRKACDLVLAHFDDAQRVYYLKTSTGKNGFEGATIESATTILEA
ncbi:aldolase [Rhizoclosmatium globosum]|uniref:deoxyribose-phosphate aldolase n=1 Tax=Rhizoclosmatium globosum TaxID=329046 RepID=A0A1Y2C214_9FUNG|nr:aldolase [Rhizoclosmatium globosum]|eukprot:ORY41078.1 aldolase [Rhizoclosmatium globosum]